MKIGKLAIHWGEMPQAKRRAALGDIQLASQLGAAESGGWADPKYGDYYAQSVPAYRAIKLRADAIASAPLRVYQQRADGSPEPVEATHPVQDLLSRVNQWWTAADLLRATEINLSLWGTAYWFIDKTEQRPSLWSLRPDRVRVVPARGGVADQYIQGFTYEGPMGRRVPLMPEEVVWFRYFNPLDEYAGFAPIAAARLTLDMGRDALKFNAGFFKNSAMPQDVVFMAQGPLAEEEVEDFYRRLEARFKGPTKSWRPMLWDLSQGAEPKRLGLTQRDMEFLATLNFTVEDAARIWGVPPPKMYSQAQSVYNNVKQADIEFYTDTISTEWRFMEAEINEMLMPALALGQDLFVAFDTSRILPLQEAFGELHDRVRLDVAAGILTINEVRADRNLKPVSWGDTWWLPFGLAPADSGVIAGDSQGEASVAPKHLGINDADILVRAGRGHLRRLRQSQQDFAQLHHRLFADQLADVLKSLRSTTRASTIPSAGHIFDYGEWEKRFAEAGSPLFESSFALSANGAATDFHLSPLNFALPEIQQIIKDRIALWARLVNEETGRLIIAEVQEAMRLGEGIRALQERIEKVFRLNDIVRSERIARTETLALASRGHLTVYQQSGVVEQKRWLATMDDRTRDDHLEANGQVVGLNEYFVVGGERIEAPGLGSPAQSIQCRCTVTPVVRRESLRQSPNGHVGVLK